MLWSHNAIMADEQIYLQEQLFKELKKRFPEVPNNVVTTLMQKNDFIRERCIDALGRESYKYLDKYLDNGLPKAVGNIDIAQQPDSRIGTQTGLPSIIPNPTFSQDAPSSQHGPFPNDSKYSTLYVGGINHSPTDSQNGPHLVLDRTGRPTDGNFGYPGSYNSKYSNPQASGPSSYYPFDDDIRTPPKRTIPPQSFAERFPQASQSYRTPSPKQPYPAVQFPRDYQQTHSFHYHNNSPNSRGNSGGQSGKVYTQQGPQPYHQNYMYMPGQSPGSVTTPPGSVSDLWMYHQNPHSSQSSGANTPTRSPFPVFQNPMYSTDFQPEYDPFHGVYGNQPHPIISGGPNSPHERRRSSEDGGYTQALLLHQRMRMDKLEQDLTRSYQILESYKKEVSDMERESIERRNQRTSSFPSREDVNKMREENRRLLIDIHLMTREIDIFSNDQGVVDSRQQQNFYNNIGTTGQRGSIHAGSDDSIERVPSQVQDAPRVCPPRPPPPTVLPTPGADQVNVQTARSEPEPDPDDGEQWSCSACTFLNHPLLDRCEFCEMPRINTGSS